MNIYKRIAKSISFGKERKLSEVIYIVIHGTGNIGDTAKNNVDFYATGNIREAGAQYFIDKKGNIAQSIETNRVAYSVGGDQRSGSKGEAKYYKKCTNENSVSIELCDSQKGISWEQLLATRTLVREIQKKCPNAKNIIRHWDVNGKVCPSGMTGEINERWKRLHNFLVKNYQFKVQVTKKAAIRSSGKVTPTNKISTVAVGTRLNITKVVGNWGRLKDKTGDGKYRWIVLSKVKEI